MSVCVCEGISLNESNKQCEVCRLVDSVDI